jgi:hypothetical protein
MAPRSYNRVGSRLGCISGYAANRTTESEAVARAHLIAVHNARGSFVGQLRARSLTRNIAELSRRLPMERGGLQDN